VANIENCFIKSKVDFTAASGWLQRLVRPLHSSLHGLKSRAVAGSKCVNTLLRGVVPPGICFGDLM
jgi:hypothetical protein